MESGTGTRMASSPQNDVPSLDAQRRAKAPIGSAAQVQRSYLRSWISLRTSGMAYGYAAAARKVPAWNVLGDRSTSATQLGQQCDPAAPQTGQTAAPQTPPLSQVTELREWVDAMARFYEGAAPGADPIADPTKAGKRPVRRQP